MPAADLFAYGVPRQRGGLGSETEWAESTAPAEGPFHFFGLGSELSGMSLGKKTCSRRSSRRSRAAVWLQVGVPRPRTWREPKPDVRSAAANASFEKPERREHVAAPIWTSRSIRSCREHTTSSPSVLCAQPINYIADLSRAIASAEVPTDPASKYRSAPGSAAAILSSGASGPA